jgi:hypothetical protein
MTVSDRDWDLIQREIDGANTEDDSQGLRERRAREPELDAGYRALVELERTLGEVELVEPPGDLAEDIMRQVRQRGAPAPGRGWLPGLTDWVTRRPVLALASSLAVGLIAGVLVATLLGGGGLAPLDEGAVSGTLLPPAHLGALPVVDEARLDGPGLRGTAVTHRGRAVVVVEIEILSEGGTDLVVEADATGLRPRGFECTGNVPVGGAVIETGRVWVHQVGPGRCYVSLDVVGADPESVAVRLGAGQEQAEATLRTERTMD